MFLALIDESLRNPADAKIILNVFKKLNVDLFSLIEDIEHSFDGPKTVSTDRRVRLSWETEKILKVSYLESEILRSEYIDVEQILLSYLRNGSAFSEEILKSKHNITYQNVKDIIERIN